MKPFFRKLIAEEVRLDPVTYVVVATILLVTAMLAGYLPVRQLAHLDPIQALRQQ